MKGAGLHHSLGLGIGNIWLIALLKALHPSRMYGLLTLLAAFLVIVNIDWQVLESQVWVCLWKRFSIGLTNLGRPILMVDHSCRLDSGLNKKEKKSWKPAFISLLPASGYSTASCLTSMLSWCPGPLNYEIHQTPPSLSCFYHEYHRGNEGSVEGTPLSPSLPAASFP